MLFKDVLKHKASDIDGYLNDYLLGETNQFESALHDSMRYSLLAGGKRIRPIIFLEICKLYGIQDKHSIGFACSLEMIHTYSLIHDDLPAMDDDDLRRGKPTNHKMYGEAMAILAGDGLLNYAYENMLHVALQANDLSYIKAMKVIAQAAGHAGMIGGQVADIMSEDKIADKSTLSYIHKHKTGDLLMASFVASGHLCKCKETDLQALEKIGYDIGLLFQIADDLLDIESTEDLLGKPIGSDEKNNKLTYPSLYGVKASYDKKDELVHSINEQIGILPGDTSFLKELVKFISERKH